MAGLEEEPKSSKKINLVLEFWKFQKAWRTKNDGERVKWKKVIRWGKRNGDGGKWEAKVSSWREGHGDQQVIAFQEWPVESQKCLCSDFTP